MDAFAQNQVYGPSHYNANYSDRYYCGEEQDSSQRPTGSRRICGLRPVWFWTVAVLIVLLSVGAAAGGVADGMLRRQKQTPSPASETSTAPPAELQDSQLSAVKWTDSTGAQRKAAFYQRNGTLHVSRNGGGDGTAGWSELDIESQFPEGAVAAMNATPLAASVIGGAIAEAYTSFSIALYFIDATNRIRDLRHVRAGGSIAHMLGGVRLGDHIVVFQVNGGDLHSVHGPDWSDTPTRIVGANIGTPLALTRAAYVNTSSGCTTTATPTLTSIFFNDKEPLDWNPGILGVISGLESSKASPALTAAPSGPKSVVQVATLKGAGSAVVSFVRDTTGRFEDSSCDLPARFAKVESVNTGAPSPEGVAVISLSHNFGLYLITDDGTRILESSRDSINMATDGWSNSGPDSFRFQGTVV